MSHDEYEDPLHAARAHAMDWLDSLPERRIQPELAIEAVKDRLGRDLPVAGDDATRVVHHLAEAVEPGLIAMQSPRFYGFVIGGTYPAALAADWLVSAWDQNAGSRQATPGVVAAEELAGDWLLSLLGLPAEAGVGFSTGATTANLSGLLAARSAVLRRLGWDVERDGLAGGPPITFLAGDSVHSSILSAGQLAGLGRPRTVGADPQGRISLPGLDAALAAATGPVVVALQAGDVHSGCFDDFASAIPLARAAGAWVHVDGAFGLWAGASPALRHLVEGYELADSWATDAHKTLNVPYDCGVAIVRDPSDMLAALGTQAAYLPVRAGVLEPFDRAVELSRRARGVPVWAALRALGRDGVAGLVDGLVAAARGLAAGFTAIPGLQVVNDVVFTQVCLAAVDDATTTALGDWLRADSTAWPSNSTWQGRQVVRFSVSNRGTDAAQVARTVDAVARAAAALGIS
ncbi:MAG: pyridoxal-dependent decarboxylase [Propionicimonas sp.]|nr:pyridoxal-dependent decarboxylase [Propionicimonas sp.]